MSSVLAFIIVIGILVFIHELGHFLVAKWCRVGVETFSLGFGPKIVQKRIGETVYCISAIPLGGYVKMVGEEQGKAISKEDVPRSFSHKKLYKKFMIVAAGPVFNFLLAILIFYFLYQFSGMYLVKPVVGEVSKGTPASEAGIKPGDAIREINGNPVESWSDMAGLIMQSNGSDLKVLLERDGDRIFVTLTPELREAKNKFQEREKRYMIGVAAAGEVLHKPLNPIQAMKVSLEKNWDIVKLTIVSVGKMINGSISTDNLGGPIMIAQMAGEQAEAGAQNFAFFLALLSINLGIINLFPVPVLDGGHLMFFTIEAFTGKEVSEAVREKANQVGVALLVLLMVFVFYNDIVRIVNNG